MKEITKNFTLQLVVGLITFGISVFFWYFAQHESRSLTISLESVKTTVSLPGAGSDDLKLLYKSKPINSLSILEFTIINNGNSSIKKNDFSFPLSIKINGNIVSEPTVTSKKPVQLNPIFFIRDNSLELLPLLLNKGDMFKIQLTVVDLKNDLSEGSIGGRIVGVDKINFTNNQHSNKNYKTIAFITVILSILISGILNILFFTSDFTNSFLEFLKQKTKTIFLSFPKKN